MNKDIRLATNYFDHPKYRKLRKRLGAKGALSHICLLTFVGKVMWSGTLEDMDAEDIAEAARWRGDPEKFVDCLLELRLLDKGSKWYEIHNWPKWNSFAMKAEARSEVGRQNSNKRWQQRYKKALKEIEQSQVDNAIGNANGNAAGNAPSPPPPPSPPPSLEGDGGGGEVATPHVEDGGDPPWTDPSYNTIISIAEDISEKYDCPELIEDVEEQLANRVSTLHIGFALAKFTNSYKGTKASDPGEYFRELLAMVTNANT
jgi:hypothetical protein